MAWDITTAAYASTKDISPQDSTSRDVAFSPDGTKMFVVGSANGSVYRYDLSTAWDITTAAYVSLKDVSAQETVPTGAVFSGDGTKMFVAGLSNDNVYRYDLSTAWDITSATYVSLKSVSAQSGVPTGVTFSGDGTKMFVVGDANDSVYRYDLSTAWDITSATYVSLKDVSAQDVYPYGFTFSGDGTKMFVAGLSNDNVYRYDLSTAWDITSATYVSLKSVSAQSGVPTGVTFSGDGTKMFVVDNANNSVYRYDMAPATVTLTPAAASSASDAEVTAGSVTVASVLASATSSTLAAVVVATLALTGTPTEATSATDAAAATATVQTSGTPADATSTTDAAPTSEDFSTATPPERTDTIAAENRATTIPAENRTTGALP